MLDTSNGRDSKTHVLTEFLVLSLFQVNGSAKPVPPPRDHLRVEKDGRLINIGDRNYNQSTGAGQIAQVIEPTHEQEMSIKKFQVSVKNKMRMPTLYQLVGA